MKINGNEIRPGNVIEHQGSLWVAVKAQAVKPGKGPAYAQVELKNLINGSKLNERFRSSESVERVRLEQQDYQFLYKQDDMLVFMDTTSYEQLEIAEDFVGERAAFLQDGMKVTVESHEGKPGQPLSGNGHGGDRPAEQRTDGDASADRPASI
jgi:elongation factor P